MEIERNYYKVSATGSRTSTRVTLGYELLQRPKGTRKWQVVGRTQDKAEAEKWADGQ